MGLEPAENGGTVCASGVPFRDTYEVMRRAGEADVLEPAGNRFLGSPVVTLMEFGPAENQLPPLSQLALVPY